MDRGVCTQTMSKKPTAQHTRSRRSLHGRRSHTSPRRRKFARHVSHHEIDETRHFAKRVERDDVRMPQARSCPGLASEAFAQHRSSCLIRRQDLDGDIAIERELMRKVHGAHPAATKEMRIVKASAHRD